MWFCVVLIKKVINVGRISFSMFLLFALSNIEPVFGFKRATFAQKAVKIAYSKIIEPAKLANTSFDSLCYSFFTPDDEVRSIIVGLIASETRKISAALYMITDQQIIQALCDAPSRGIKVELIVDAKVADQTKSEIEMLEKHNVVVYKKFLPFGSMHNKFWLFHNSLENQRFIGTGSTNPTLYGTTRNDENFLLTSLSSVWNAFKGKFSGLKHSLKTAYPMKKAER